MRLGWGVIAMGVMARPAYVVDDALAERIAPLVSQVETDYVFWNYSLEEKAAEAATLPVWLVTLEGREVVLDEEEGSSLMRPAGPTRVLEDARLVRAERIPPTWLESWRPVFRAPGSPWRIRLDDPPFDEEAGMAGLAATILDALRAMRAVPAPSEALHHDGGRHLDFS